MDMTSQLMPETTMNSEGRSDDTSDEAFSRWSTPLRRNRISAEAAQSMTPPA